MVQLEILKDIGLTDGEIKVYRALLGLGETTTGPIVDESGVSVSKVYGILNRLAKKGLVSQIIKGKTRYFMAADPERLLEYFQEKEEALAEERKELTKVVPLLKKQIGSLLTEETAQVFEGMRGIQTARERSLRVMKKGDEMWIIGISRTPYDRLLGYFRDFHRRRAKKGVRCHFLYNRDAKEFAEINRKFPLSEIRFMPVGITTHAWIEVYMDTVTIGINYGKSFSIVIINKEVANSFKNYAKLLWSISTN
ncbi:MAG: hypothetical protein HY514_03075 [Candidatus Aenigmarchaeota archaeon]|nr:hypothetical protein [Candidatus Aenigmarchaeota archaeon]